MSDFTWYLSFAWGRAPYALDLPEVVIGHGERCTLQVDEPAACEEHARFLLPDEGGVAIEPIAGTTLLNGKAIKQRTALADGDFVQIGQSVLTVRAGRPKSPSAPDNFVVGSVERDGAQLATLMMESPLVRSSRRDPARTIEADASGLMAAIRDTRVEPPPARPNQRTLTATRPSSGRPATLSGVAPDPDEPTRDLAAAPTMLGGHTQSSPSSWRPRASTMNPELTPLPAPLPPPDGASIPDLGALVVQAQANRAALGAQETQALPVPMRLPDPLSSRQTQLPMPAPVPASTPLSSQKTQLASQPTMSGIATEPAMDAAPTPLVKPIDPRARTSAPTPVQAAPEKGAFGSFSRALAFFRQMFELTRSEPTLLSPLYYDLAVATPIMFLVSLLMLFVHSSGALYAVLLVGTGLLYFVDYFCNALTASLLYDHATTGRTSMPNAMARVKRSLPGIVTFATVSAVLDFAATYARERKDVVARMLLRLLHAIWTTATYVMIPAMVIEGISFKRAFLRSKALMDRDPTGVGAGVVALSLCSYILGAAMLTLAYFAMRLGSHVHPVLGVMLFFTLVNSYWAVSGWMKIAYSTCFYLWAQRCEAAGQADETLAPAPLRHALASG